MKRTCSLVLAVLLLLGAPPVAHAVGFGVYASLGKGSTEWDPQGGASPMFPLYPSFTTNNEHRSGGFVFDTNLAGDGIFNYQMTLGYDAFEIRNFLLSSSPYNPSLPTMPTNFTMEGFVWTHAFGFGGNVAPGVRFWFGPELRFEWAIGRPAPGITLDTFGAGLGPVVAVNFAIGDRFTAALKSGYYWMRHDADVSGPVSPMSNVGHDYDIREKLFTVNLELMLRSLGDR